MRFTNQEAVISVLPGILVLVIVLSCFRHVDDREYFIEFILPAEFKGKVTDKYERGPYKTLRLIVDNEEITYSADHWTGLYKTCKLGDSIVKKAGQKRLQLYRFGELQKKFDYDFKGTHIINRFKDEKRTN